MYNLFDFKKNPHNFLFFISFYTFVSIFYCSISKIDNVIFMTS